MLQAGPIATGDGRKESLDSVDFELIKLGLHKSSAEIRRDYLNKLNIEAAAKTSSAPDSTTFSTEASLTTTTTTTTTTGHHFRPLVIASQMVTTPGMGPGPRGISHCRKTKVLQQIALNASTILNETIGE